MRTATRHEPARASGWTPQEQYVVLAHLRGLLGAALAYTGDDRQAESLVRDALRSTSARPMDVDEPSVWLHARLWASFQERAGGDGPGDVAIDPEPAPTLGEALAALPAPSRAAVHLVDVEGLSYRQLAQVLGASTHEAAALLHGARRRLVAAMSAGSRRPTEAAT